MAARGGQRKGDPPCRSPPKTNLRLATRFGLVKSLRLVRGLRRQFDEDDRTRIAETIREHLALAGWRIEPGPGIGGHSQLAWPANKRDRS